MTIQFWYINSHSLNNKNYMIPRNKCYIGLGDNQLDYERRKLSPNSTFFQFSRFQKNAKNGDIILLYHNTVGYIFYGVFTGVVDEPTTILDMAPDWSPTEVQKHICVETWIPFDEPVFGDAHPMTLCQKKSNIHNILSQDVLSSIHNRSI